LRDPHESRVRPPDRPQRDSVRRAGDLGNRVDGAGPSSDLPRGEEPPFPAAISGTLVFNVSTTWGICFRLSFRRRGPFFASRRALSGFNPLLEHSLLTVRSRLSALVVPSRRPARRNTSVRNIPLPPFPKRSQPGRVAGIAVAAPSRRITPQTAGADRPKGVERDGLLADIRDDEQARGLGEAHRQEA
jgi:hypothetical protein